MRAKFTLVDVFTSRRFGGNQLGVFADARRLTTRQMQSLAHELNFSECTFVTPSKTCDARVRIFTPQREMPMAGHPTVGTAWILATSGELKLPASGIFDATFELGVGPTPIAIEARAHKPSFVWMTHRAPKFDAIRNDSARVAAALGIRADDIAKNLPIQTVTTGLPILFVPLASLDALARCVSAAAPLASIFDDRATMTPVYAFVVQRDSRPLIRSRMFAPHTDRIVEDPATGGAAGPLGAYLALHDVIPEDGRVRFAIDQGVKMGRPSRITVEVLRDGASPMKVRIGGKCVIVGDGAIEV